MPPRNAGAALRPVAIARAAAVIRPWHCPEHPAERSRPHLASPARILAAVAALGIVLVAASAEPGRAAPPVVETVTAEPRGGVWHFDVTLSHPDTGWEHYADAWRVETARGDVLGTRELLHPHVEEQPFTRSLGGVAIPAGTAQVRIRARCLVTGWSENSVAVPLD